MPILLRRCIPAPFCAQRALKKKDMQRALNKFTLSVLPRSSRESAREQITLSFFFVHLSRIYDIAKFVYNFYGGPNEGLSCPRLHPVFSCFCSEMTFFSRRIVTPMSLNDTRN